MGLHIENKMQHFIMNLNKFLHFKCRKNVELLLFVPSR